MAKITAKFKAVVEANGTVSEIDEWGKRRLAYPINDLWEGYYVLMTFTAGDASPAAPAASAAPSGYGAPSMGGDQFAELSDDDGELPF